MEEKEQLILKLLSDKEYIPMKAKEIAAIMQIPKSDYEEFRKILNKLEEEYKIRKNRKSRYSIFNNENYKKAIFRSSERGFGFAKLEDLEEEIYIRKENRNNALNGDNVLVEIIPGDKDELHREGKIVKVLKREKDTLVGIFQNNKNFGFVVPDEKNFGSDIFISKKNFGKARNNHKVLVKILKYPENGKNAEGKIIEVLGGVNEAGVDMLSLIKEYKLPYKFPDNVVEEAKKISHKIDEKEINNRLDLRNEEIFTIDGEDAKDLDDAIFVKKNNDGNYILGVHIADVSYYVGEGSNLDKEAIIRGTSIYMMDRVIPMLPRELSNGICSLNAKEDRLAMSVIMEINKDGKVISSDIKKSVIRVTERMNYSDVTKILKKSDEEVVKKYEKYIAHFELMNELSDILKKRRERDGYLNLDIPESKVILDEKGHAIDIKKYEFTVSNEIIEQFMLTANETVAEKFYWLEAPFIYRVHEVPDMEKIQELNKFLYNFGYKIKGNKENIHPKSFATVLEEIKGKPEERIISNLILRTLKIARYESVNKGHFGIGGKYYCHFTSPIRRYPDLFIHRIISKYLECNYNVQEDVKEKFGIQAVNYAESSSEREKIAQKVERDSISIKMAEYMEDRIGNEYEGIISNVTSFGVFVELENTVEGLIRFEYLGNEYYIYDEEHKILIGEVTNTKFRIGDKIKIKVIDANKQLRRIDFARVEEIDKNT